MTPCKVVKSPAPTPTPFQKPLEVLKTASSPFFFKMSLHTQSEFKGHSIYGPYCLCHFTGRGGGACPPPLDPLLNCDINIYVFVIVCEDTLNKK